MRPTLVRAPPARAPAHCGQPWCGPRLRSSVDETPGTFSLVYQTIERDYTGAGLGPSEGTLVITESDDGAVSVEFETALSFVGASADIGGTVIAPFCD